VFILVIHRQITQVKLLPVLKPDLGTLRGLKHYTDGIVCLPYI